MAVGSYNTNNSSLFSEAYEEENNIRKILVKASHRQMTLVSNNTLIFVTFRYTAKTNNLYKINKRIFIGLSTYIFYFYTLSLFPILIQNCRNKKLHFKLVLSNR